MSQLDDCERRIFDAEEKRDRIKADLLEMDKITNPTAGEIERGQRLLSGYKAANEAVQRAKNEHYQAMVGGVRSGVLKTELGSDFGPSNRAQSSGTFEVDIHRESASGFVARAHDVLERVDGVPDDMRESLGRMVDREPYAGAAVVALSNPEYFSAFGKVLKNPERGLWTLTESERAAVEQVETVRSALSTNTGTAGYLLPTLVAPFTTLANDGAANPIRQISRHETTVVSPFRAPVSAGINAEWKPEAQEAADASPAFTKVDVDLHAVSAYAFGSYEIFMDTNAADQLPGLFLEARDRIESDGFVVGSGSGAPLGVVTGVTAVTASRVTPTTGGTFTSASIADVYKVWNGLSPRGRNSAGTAWVANNTTLSTIRQMGATMGANYSVALTGTLERLMGRPIFEASAMASAATTGSNILLAGDFSGGYCVVDHVLGASLEYIGNVVGGNARPTAQRGWYYHGRTGGSVLDPSRFRVLKL